MDNVKNTDLIIVIDTNGKILYYNNFNDKINTFNYSETIGKYVWEVYTWVNKGTPLFKVMETGQSILNNYLNYKVGGKNMTIINSAFPLKTSKGIIGAIGLSVASQETDKNDALNKRIVSNITGKYTFNDIKTNNSQLISLKYNLEKAAKTNSNIFIFGETGTGKELFAHSIHNASLRNEKSFISQNCAAIPETLMESTFFGTRKGAFTGSEDKIGLFEACNEGTLFLDEINSMPYSMQSKVLRVIEDGYFRRLGDTKDIYCDVRIIAASNESPKEIIANKKLRMDLFYRLNVVSCEIPPLRERPEDIDLLIKFYIKNFNNLFDRNILGISDDARDILLKHNWPGNIREFKNVIEGIFNIIEEPYISIDYIPSYLLTSANRSNLNSSNNFVDKVNAYEKALLEEALIKHKYNITSTANTLGLPRQTLYYKLKKYKILP